MMQRGRKSINFYRKLGSHTKRESFWRFFGQIGCLGWFSYKIWGVWWLFSGLQSEVPLPLRNLTLRQQLAEHDACLWMKIGFLSKSSLQMSKIHHFRYHPTAFSKMQFLDKIRLWTRKICWQTRATSNHSANVAVLSLCISESLFVCCIVRAFWLMSFFCNFLQSLLWLSVVFCCILFCLERQRYCFVVLHHVVMRQAGQDINGPDIFRWSITCQHLGRQDVAGYSFEMQPEAQPTCSKRTLGQLSSCFSSY